MDQPDKYKHDQDLLFRDLEAKAEIQKQAMIEDMLLRAEEVGLHRTSLKFRMALKTLTTTDIEQQIKDLGGRRDGA